MTSRTPSWLARHPVPAFYALAFLISWLGFVPIALYSHGILPSANFLYDFLGNGGPALAAMIVAFALARGKGLRELFAPLIQWRVGAVWYLVALFGQAAIFAIVIAITALLGEPMPDLANIQPWFIVFPILFQHLLINVWEEIGWRGFALPRLQARYSALVSSLIVGLLWNLWHLPLFFTVGHMMSNFPVVAWFFGNLGLAIIYTWVYNNARESLLIMTLLHAAQNTASVLVFIAADGIPASGYILDAALKVLIAVVLVAIYRPARLSKKTSQ